MGFHATIRKICPNWDDLEEVVGDHALARAAFSSDDLNDETPTEEGDDDEEDVDAEDFPDADEEEAEQESQESLASLYSNEENRGNKKPKKKASSTPLGLPSSKKSKTKKAKEDSDLSASLLGSTQQNAYYEDAKRRRARELRERVAEYEEQRRHNAAMERAALPPNMRIQCYREFQSIKNEPWASDAAVKTMFPPEIAEQCIAMREAERATDQFDEDGNNMYEA